MDLMVLVPICAVAALAFAFLMAKKVMRFSEGTEKMSKIASAVRKGANAYLKSQITMVALFFGVVFLILLIHCSRTRWARLFRLRLSRAVFSGLSGYRHENRHSCKRATNAARDG
ncbi:MAG: sodium/proton-translocating pyrophosphatase [Oscillospiraceae bacterium]